MVKKDPAKSTQAQQSIASERKWNDETLFVQFKLNDHIYAVEGRIVRKILPDREKAFIPGCPPYIVGVIHEQGRIESVVALKQLMGIPAGDDEAGMIILIETDAVSTGLLIDKVVEVSPLMTMDIKPPISTLPDAFKDIVVGVVEEDDQEIIILDAEDLAKKVAAS